MHIGNNSTNYCIAVANVVVVVVVLENKFF
jgi:hypothetical protein